MKKIIYLSVLIFSTLFSFQAILPNETKTTLEGKVVDAASGEPILFAFIAFYQNDKLLFGAETDIDGKYQIALEPGIYNIEAHYIGYTPQKEIGVIIKAIKLNRLDFAINEGIMMEVAEIIEYKIPLIEIDNTTSGATVTEEEIRLMPTRSKATVAARVAGVSVVNYENESYAKIIENKPQSPFLAPLSTIAIDVDRASYSNIRRFIEGGSLPPEDAVRIEEMINYFNYDYPTPESKTRPFKVFSQLTECPWNSENKLLHIGLQGRKIDTKNLPKSNLVFLIDVSGSMQNHNKLPLVKESFKLLVDNLRPEDQVAIVTYAGSAGIALESTSANQKMKIIEAIENLGAGGSTSGAEGIKTAYHIARKYFKQDGNNRVILATDGDFNIGISSNDDLLKLIEKERNSGIFLSVLGYGMNNYKDDKMQLLADAGNGNHAYIDDIQEAKKTLVTEFGGTLFTIAKDVKVQMEFNPAYVSKYRLIGYENRKMTATDYRNDAKDAGELGAGHSVTVLYEITPSIDDFVEVEDKLMYQKRSSTLKENKELGTVRLRYKTPNGHKAWEFSEIVSNNTTPFDKVSDKTKHAAAIAEFGMLLRNSKYKEDASYSNVEAALQSIDKTKYLTEDVIFLVKKAMELGNLK